MLMDDLRGRLANRVQLTTDGHKAYLQAVEEAFGADIDYAMFGEALRRAASFSGGSATLQPVRMRRDTQREDRRQPRSEPYQYELHRAGEPDDADEHATVYRAHQRVLKEA